jgi:ribose/xylose/arabinose/galactoside ABC-type transport system permease subunit
MEDKLKTTDGRSLRSGSFMRFMIVVGIYFAAALFILLGAVLQATGVIRGFLSVQNFINIIDTVSMLGIVAVGMAFVTYSGNMADMSVPTTMALTGIVAVQMLQYGFWPAIGIAIVTGLIIGMINAIVIGRFRANPIIWTLAVNYVTMGVIRLVWVNKQIYPDTVASTAGVSQSFDSIYRLNVVQHIGGNDLLNIRLPMLMMLILVVIGQFVLSRTSFGGQLKMTGASFRAAKFTGVHVESVIGLAFVVCAFTATLGGLAVTSLSRVGAWYNGAGYDFRAVTAVVIGGMTLAGGRGSIVGVLGGVLIIGLINNIMTLLGIPTLSQDIIRGAIFIIVVGINAKSLRSLGRDDT